MKSRDPFRFEVPDRDTIAVRLDVERQVAPHRPEADDAEIRSAHDTIPRCGDRALEREIARPDTKLLAEERGEPLISERDDPRC